MKTALELLGYHGHADGIRFSNADLELVARRAREEALEMAAQELDACGLGHCPTQAARIRALPTEPK